MAGRTGVRERDPVCADARREPEEGCRDAGLRGVGASHTWCVMETVRRIRTL